MREYPAALIKKAVDALEEIQTEYPPVAKLDVAMLCDPWLSGESCEMDFEQGGLSFAVLGSRTSVTLPPIRDIVLRRGSWLFCALGG